MAMVIKILVLLTSFSAMATVTYKAKDCPEEFLGHVKEIVSPVGPTSAFSTQKVIFENSKTVKGNLKELVSLDILENGPFKIVSGEDYRVQTRNGKLCWIEEI
ncbi:MAG TPA: hypothetical protein VNJ01_03890 [Bacteriovoracaceae bacterium]|nr:hypothetical protein [Bacteriovoracaceae bacterium]